MLVFGMLVAEGARIGRNTLPPLPTTLQIGYLLQDVAAG